MFAKRVDIKVKLQHKPLSSPLSLCDTESNRFCASHLSRWEAGQYVAMGSFMGNPSNFELDLAPTTRLSVYVCRVNRLELFIKLESMMKSDFLIAPRRDEPDSSAEVC